MQQKGRPEVEFEQRREMQRSRATDMLSRDRKPEEYKRPEYTDDMELPKAIRRDIEN